MYPPYGYPPFMFSQQSPPSTSHEIRSFLKMWRQYEREQKKDKEEEEKKKKEKDKGKTTATLSTGQAFVLMTACSPLIMVTYFWAMAYAFRSAVEMLQPIIK